jgi:predicted ATPase
MLLLLDNVEHLAGARLALEQLVAGAPGVTVLLTSRGAVPGVQRTLELGPLAIPACPDKLEHAEASRLFLQAARQARLSFEPDAAERSAIVRICTAAGGIPLMLVQAAQLVRTMSCTAIAALLAERPLELNVPLRDLPPRQQRVRANIAYGWALLAASEQLAVRRHVEQGRATMHTPHLSDELARILASVGLLVRAAGGAPILPPLLRTFLAEPA